ncbi:Carboxylic acid reductase [Marinomonas gallaica]|uniref:Carboxylic acid reductase n=1 Tax=Marinomonas gallaica TaxID=1806667 RepID=A0A1C3JNM5_9GAMM|nr:feruloyl-CoA synthase [Marinomonas gallaica]SBT16640.1 Carboxylic acid reductase [Marinomonas gallaica]SBT20356.1 Carboxylic acid reductase [Marinomonas gallaica]
MTSEFHPIKVVSHSVAIEKRDNGEQIISCQTELAEYARCLTDRLVYWAERTPEVVFVAQRDDNDEWDKYTYAEALDKVRQLASWLIEQPVSPERPIAFLSGNSLEHLMLAMAGYYIGVPHAPVSPAYSLVATDYAKLKHVIDLLTPGLIVVDKLAPYEKAIKAVSDGDVPVAVMYGDTAPELISNPTVSFAQFWQHPKSPAIEELNAEVSGDTVAKILFTSGTTGMPKGVMNTHRMLCANAVMIRDTMAFLADEPPVMVDWLPWNHTFGGNHNVSIALYNGGSFYLDDGKPTEAHFHKTLNNLAEVAPTVYFNVPKGFELLVKKLQQDDELARKFFSRLQFMFFAAAGMAQHIWDDIDALAIQYTGKKIPILTGLGATETAPSVTFASIEESASGVIGKPAPGVILKLVPNEGKLEARVKAVTVMPGYWRQPELTAKSFDDEGFYCLGDAIAYLDENKPERGFRFDGRVSEDFKLDSGTWVSAGTLRAKFISAFAPLVQDVVLCGTNRSFITGLVFPDVVYCQTLVDNGSALSTKELVEHPIIRAVFEEKLKAFKAQGTGSSTVVDRILLQHEAPCIDAHEVTDKGSLNQRNVQDYRADQVDELYQEPKSVSVISV